MTTEIQTLYNLSRILNNSKLQLFKIQKLEVTVTSITEFYQIFAINKNKQPHNQQTETRRKSMSINQQQKQPQDFETLRRN